MLKWLYNELLSVQGKMRQRQMKLEIRTFKEDKLLDMIAVEYFSASGFRQELEECILRGCHELAAPLPLWLEHNTKEMAAFHQTVFFSEQFMEKTHFDRMQIKLLEF